MKIKYLGYKHLIHLMFFSVLCLLVYSSSIGIAIGQKKPTSLKLDVDMDDEKLCRQTPLQGSQFCKFFALYDGNKDDTDIDKTTAFNARNDMIDLVVGQVDTFYKLRKDGRRTKIRWYETVLDFLRIGGDLAVTIMNGERAKTIVGAALSAVGSGRADYNKNFQVLQTQILINKMNAKRAQILTEIIGKKDKPVRATKPSDAYSWYEAKNDLRRYLLAGTFDDALDTLVEETGAQVVKAEKTLDNLTKNDVTASRKASSRLTDLEVALASSNPATKEAATKILRKIVISLNNDDSAEEIQEKLKEANITAASDGATILKALKKIRRDFSVIDDRDDLVIKINQAINDAGGVIE